MTSKLFYLFIIFSSLIFISSTITTSLKNQDDYIIIKKSEGDINFDGINDLVIVGSNSETENKSIIIFINDSNGNVLESFENEKISKEFIDRYNKIPEVKIEEGELIISYYGGMCFRESQNLVFEYRKTLNNLFFKVSQYGEHNACDDDIEPVDYEVTSIELKKVKFSDFTDELL